MRPAVGPRISSGIVRSLLGVGLFITTSLVPSAARADDCPPGSIFRSQDGYSFCEPTVCQSDSQCNPDEVCRPIPLCLQVGTLDPKAAALHDGGQRLVATQRCGPDKTCTQNTVCSDLGRCVSRDTAEKMGVLSAASSGSPATSDAKTGAEKKTCGCRAVGTPDLGAGLGLAVSTALVALVAVRRRATRSRSSA